MFVVIVLLILSPGGSGKPFVIAKLNQNNKHSAAGDPSLLFLHWAAVVTSRTKVQQELPGYLLACDTQTR